MQLHVGRRPQNHWCHIPQASHTVSAASSSCTAAAVYVALRLPARNGLCAQPSVLVAAMTIQALEIAAILLWTLKSQLTPKLPERDLSLMSIAVYL